MKQNLHSRSATVTKIRMIRILLLIIPIMVACNRPKSGNAGQRNAKTGPDSTQSGASLMVTVSKQTQRLEGIRVARLDTVLYHKSINAYGVVLSPDRLIRLQNRRAGLQQQIRKEKAQLKVSRQEYRRQDTLYKNHGTSRKTLQQARSRWISDQTDLKTSRQALRALMDSNQTYWGSKITGWVQKGSQALQQIINQHARIVRVTPVNTPAGSFQPPETVSMNLNQHKKFAGRFISTSPTINPRIQQQSYYYLVDQPPVPLAPGRNLNAELPTGKARQGVIIPDSAVIWTQGEPWFYVQKKPGTFRRRLLKTACFQNGRWYLSRSAFASGRLPKVVVSGADLLFAKEQRAGQSNVSTGGDDN